MSFDDTDLRTYLAGDASVDLQARIETALATDPALEERLMALDPLAEVTSHVRAVWPDAPTDMTITAVPTATVRRPVWQLATAAAVGAIIASLAFVSLPLQDTKNWRAEVATYQALYARETIADLSFSPAELDGQLAAASDRVGFPDLNFVAQSTDTLTLLRTQILEHDGAPLAQIVFATPDGDPVALCLIAGADGGDMSIALREGMQSAAFSSAGHSWLLIGTDDAQIIRDNATIFQDRIARQG